MTLLLITLLAACGPVSADPTPLASAHAHNDYHHARPLLDALEAGFCSVEADVFEVEGELLVGHDRSELRADRTLERLYLEPLWARVQQNGGRVYRDGPSFTLLIDFKSDAQPTYAALQQRLAAYEAMLSQWVNGRQQDGAVQVVISGNRPIETVVGEYEAGRCRVAIDGRLPDLEDSGERPWLPLVSDRWTAHFRWNGQGELPEAESRRLEKIVQKAHQQNRRLRFWATPDRPAAWSALQAAGVDLINTDDLAGLAQFLRRVEEPALGIGNP